jgi:putative oxidoreductase
MNRFSKYQQWVQTHEDVFVGLLRVYLGTGLLVKGIFMMSNRDYLLNMLGELDNLWFAPAAVAHYVIPAHIVGGALLALGLLTRVAVLFQIPVLVGAVFYLYLPKMMLLEPRQNLEFSALVLFILVLFGVFGAGRYSVDYLLSRKAITPHDAPDIAPSRPLA